MFVEKLARTNASPISSTIDDKALPITSTVMGSMQLAKRAAMAVLRGGRSIAESLRPC
jgi:hypothetical protein